MIGQYIFFLPLRLHTPDDLGVESSFADYMLRISFCVRFGDLTTQQPSFWNGNTLPWCGTLFVDGQAYTWMGIPSNCAPGGIQATQRSMSFTASKTTFVMRAGTVDVSLYCR